VLLLSFPFLFRSFAASVVFSLWQSVRSQRGTSFAHYVSGMNNKQLKSNVTIRQCSGFSWTCPLKGAMSCC